MVRSKAAPLIERPSSASTVEEGRPAGGTLAIARASFWVLFAFSLTNIGALVTRVAKQESAINPIVFAIGMAVIIVLVKARGGGSYLRAAMFFIAIFALGGLLGPERTSDQYVMAMLIGKTWIAIAGLPWLALRLADRTFSQRLAHATTLIGGAGSLLAVAQVINPGPFAKFVSEIGRGAGLWINPNNCAVVICMSSAMLLAAPFRSRPLNTLLHLAFVTGMFATLSRAGVAVLLIVYFVYGVLSRRASASALLGLALAVVVIQSSGYLLSIVPEKQTARVQSIVSAFQGDLDQLRETDSRSRVWDYAVDAALEHWVVGRGHGAMDRIVPIGSGLGPHNYYLYVLGNSGIAALLAWLAYLAVLGRAALRAGNPTTRAALCSAVIAFALLVFYDHSLPGHQFLGALLATLVAAIHHLSEQGAVESHPSALT